MPDPNCSEPSREGRASVGNRAAERRFRACPELIERIDTLTGVLRGPHAVVLGPPERIVGGAKRVERGEKVVVPGGLLRRGRRGRRARAGRRRVP